MKAQELEAKVELAEALFKETFIKLYLHEWWAEVMERRELITPSDWLNVSIMMMEILLNAQELKADEREKLAFEITQELHKRLSNSETATEVS